MRLPRCLPAVLAATLAVTALAGCSSSPADPDTLVIYNAQHADLLGVMTDAFTADTGIKVEIRQGGDADMANQLVKEGRKSPADVFITENSPAMKLVADKGLFAPLPPATVAQVPAQYVASGALWIGICGRETSFAFDPKTFTQPSDFPASMLDLATPAWKGRFGYAPKGADFQAITAAVYALRGKAAGDSFVQGLKDNGTVYANNFAIMQAVNAGTLDAGLMYHYYFYKDRNAGGDNSRNVELHFFGRQDPGAFMSISGAGVLKASNRAAEAQRLVAYLTGAKAQQALADSGALEYPLGNGIQPNGKLPGLATIDPPVVRVEDLDAPAVVEQFRKVGLL
ncbi:MAG: extracellular solute-binding protein family 1 [Frankiales bacterium]|nr:extracellular solute-binding protein family 1 [Frankiales bacterium]